MELEYQSTNKCNYKEELDSVSILLIEHSKHCNEQE